MKRIQVVAIAIVVLHLAISVPHGMAHSDLHTSWLLPVTTGLNRRRAIAHSQLCGA